MVYVGFEKISAKRNHYPNALSYRHHSRVLNRLRGIHIAIECRRMRLVNDYGRFASYGMPYPELIARYRQAITDFAASEKPRLP